MGETKTPQLYDFGIFEPVTKPQNQLFLSLGTPGHLNKIKKHPWNIFEKYYLINVIFLETEYFYIFGKDGHRTLMKIRLITFQEAWIWDQYLSKSMLDFC